MLLENNKRNKREKLENANEVDRKRDDGEWRNWHEEDEPIRIGLELLIDHPLFYLWCQWPFQNTTILVKDEFFSYEYFPECEFFVFSFSESIFIPKEKSGWFDMRKITFEIFRNLQLAKADSCMTLAQLIRIRSWVKWSVTLFSSG